MKGAVKGPEKNERKGARKKFLTAIAKKSKFWPMRMHQIKIFYFFAPNLEKLSLSSKNLFC